MSFSLSGYMLCKGYRSGRRLSLSLSGYMLCKGYRSGIFSLSFILSKSLFFDNFLKNYILPDLIVSSARIS